MGRKAAEIAGLRFGRLVVQEKSWLCGRTRQWLRLCDCGKTHEARANNLQSGRTRSCGCLNSEARLARTVKHGWSKSKVYRAHQAMLARCYRKSSSRYQSYGGRGIRVCDRWRGAQGFTNFLQDMGRPEDSQTLERIDVNGHYSPSNCKWADWREQVGNKQDSIRITIDGRTDCLKRWAEVRGLPYKTVYARVKNGWDPIKALTVPVNRSRRRYK